MPFVERHAKLIEYEMSPARLPASSGNEAERGRTISHQLIMIRQFLPWVVAPVFLPLPQSG